ncbi:hypothetical protein BKA56DRAFT_476854 [Ilyonectria sp. MPI-CAGE-AT-0026]|nr:hypothetical protein BKA56DRAFT_476854 [Ilyonectria sp. MPI-CAGE-AT-0026]
MADPEVPERRRRRPAVSCSLCRRRKIRCNREAPCNNCMRSKNEQCVYETHPSQAPRQIRPTNTPAQLPRQPHHIAPNTTSTASTGSTVSSHPLVSSGPSSTNTSSPAGPTLSHDVEYLRNRIRQLEDELPKTKIHSAQTPSLTPSSTTSIETQTSRLAGTFHIHRNTLFGQANVFSRGIMHKTRMFGQSHWINGVALLFIDMFHMIEPFILEDTSRAFAGIKKCKALAREIKAARAPPWPSPPTRDLPSKDVADRLVQCYLRTMETVYRVLHIPSFMRDYEALWTSDAEPDTEFLVLLKLVFAIGAPTYDHNFSLRNSALKWVYEAQTWVSAPEFKAMLSMPYLQIQILLIFARETTRAGRDFVWVSAGALFRTAMYMGLHRDPARISNRTIFTIEMRRRLWNTILEIVLQSSMSSGGPPLISLGDFNTEPPQNFDDEQLLHENPIPKPDGTFTQSSVARTLRSTVPIRLTITKFLNDLESNGTYEETLALDAEFRSSYKAICRALKECESTTGNSPSQFAMRVVDFIMRRYLSSIHIPFFGPGLYETTYAYSRKVVIDASLNIWCAAYPKSSLNDTSSSEEDDFARLTSCGSTFFRTVAMQASLLITAEVRTQLQEEESLSAVRLRPTLLPVVEEAKDWCLRCIEAGETNIKGYMVSCMVAVHIEGLVRGLGKNEIPKLLVKSIEESEEKALTILEPQAAQSQVEGAGNGHTGIPLNTPPELIEGWDFMVNYTRPSYVMHR